MEREHLDALEVADRPDDMDRRNLLKLSLGAAAALPLASSPASAKTTSSADDLSSILPAKPRRVIETPLTVQWGHYDLPMRGRVRLRTYNGQTPGPTLRVRAGDQLRVPFINDLPVNKDPLDPGNDISGTLDGHNQFHGWNTTNLHSHGLHVSPDKPVRESGKNVFADNVLIAVTPKGDEIPSSEAGLYFEREVLYVYDLPTDHPPGTHWYHPHKHGSVARQVSNGMVGVIVVEDEPGAMPDYIAEATEHVLVFMQICDSNNGIDPDRADAPDADKPAELVLSEVYPDNSVEQNPTLVIRPGEVQRWRVLNGTSSQFVSLYDAAGVLEIHAIAVDGVTLDERLKVDPSERAKIDFNLHSTALAPGNRVDYIVRCPPDATEQPQVVTLKYLNTTVPRDVAVDGQPGAKMQDTFQYGGTAWDLPRPDNLADGDPDPTPFGALFCVRMEGDAVDMKWSTESALPGPGPGLEKLVDLPHDQIAQERVVTFNVATHFRKDLSGKWQDKMKMYHRANGKLFTGLPVFRMKKGTVEEWTILNYHTVMFHPFHIHINPFYVVDVFNPKLVVYPDLYGDFDQETFEKQRRRWHDTIAIPPAEMVLNEEEGSYTVLPGAVTFRTHFKEFTGAFVFHCHVLNHEDTGMMQVVEVIE